MCAWVVHKKKAHLIDGIIHLFKGEVNNMPLPDCMSDWPLGSQKDIYFKRTKEETVKKIFSLTFKGHYREELSGLDVLALRHFSPRMQTFLKDFYQRISHITPSKINSKR
jgi:hypothetical protein